MNEQGGSRFKNLIEALRGQKLMGEGPLLPGLNPVFKDTGREGIPAEALDSVVGAPLRRAVTTAQEGRFGDVLSEAASQFGKDPETSPTWENIVKKAGVENPTAVKALTTAGGILEPGIPLKGIPMSGSIKMVDSLGAPGAYSEYNRLVDKQHKRFMDYFKEILHPLKEKMNPDQRTFLDAAETQHIVDALDKGSNLRRAQLKLEEEYANLQKAVEEGVSYQGSPSATGSFKRVLSSENLKDLSNIRKAAYERELNKVFGSRTTRAKHLGVRVEDYPETELFDPRFFKKGE